MTEAVASRSWYGELPEHWGARPLKSLFRVVGGSTPKSDNQDYWDGDIIWVTPSDLQDSSIASLRGSQRTITELGLASCGTTLVPASSIVLSTRAPIGSLGIAEVPLCTNQGCKSLVPRPTVSSAFYAYLLSVTTMELRVRGKGTTFLELSSDELSAFRVPVPPLPEQTAIAAFLDRETGKIDALVEEQKRLIELLTEKRQAVISHAVTKGLNPNARMKPSGVEWLGDVPEHWDVNQIRYFAQVLRGKFTHRPRNDPAFYDGPYPFVQTGDITGSGKFIETYKQTLNERGIAVSKEFPRGTLIMAIAANIGDVAILDFPAYFPDSIVGLVPRKDTDLNYLYHLMGAMKQPMMRMATISTQMNLNVDQITGLLAAHPPIAEQVAIAEYLDEQVHELESLAEQSMHAITLLHERRSALISAAVTGKIDVRDIATQEEAA